jgi:hypothetical protein
VKTKLLVVGSAAIIGMGTLLHSGHKPRCLMQLFASEKTAVTSKASFAGLQDQGHDPKKNEKKHQKPKNHGANHHERKCQAKKASI